MKEKNYREIVGILSLSLLITATMSISGCLPEMLEEFSDYSRSAVESLLSIPAFSMMLVIAATPLLLRYLKERHMIVAGLLITGISGILPAFVGSYPVLLASRIFMGAGIGLINTKAVSMIGERFSGNLRQRLQGIRCSMETLGQACLTFIAGQLLVLGWRYTFLIYGLAFVILLLYLAFVPDAKPAQADDPQAPAGRRRLTKEEWKFLFPNILLGTFVVSAITAISLRLPNHVVASSLGSSVEGSTVLSISVLAGFAGGLFFGKLLQKLKTILLPLSMGLVTVGLITIALANSLMIAMLGAVLCGCFSTITVSSTFNRLSDHLPVETLDKANSMLLMGCNLGGFMTPYLLQAVGLINPQLSAGFLAYALLYGILSIGFFLNLARPSLKKRSC
ncbi:MAG: MFS transporter [Lachnospiraceae bacterium]|nr:MFS transporter [Lachnospiraceae bacterium]